MKVTWPFRWTVYTHTHTHTDLTVQPVQADGGTGSALVPSQVSGHHQCDSAASVSEDLRV